MRPNHPWYWAAKNAWFVEIGDTRHRLGQHPEDMPPPKKRKRGDPPPKPPKEIEQAFYRLMAADPTNPPKAADLEVCQVCDLFLDYSEKHHAAETYRGYKDFLQDFCELYGTLLAKDLKPLHVTCWLTSRQVAQRGERPTIQLNPRNAENTRSSPLCAPCHSVPCLDIYGLFW
jgi:hypothetical protein